MKLVYSLDLDNLNFNPVPYKRTTQRMKFNKDYKRYSGWKELLRNNFCSQNPTAPKEIYTIGKVNYVKPLLTGYYFVEVVITYKIKGGKRGDPDNIFKGVCDALFKNDNKVSGKISFKDGKYGAISVRIYESINEIKLD